MRQHPAAQHTSAWLSSFATAFPIIASSPDGSEHTAAPSSAQCVRSAVRLLGCRCRTSSSATTRSSRCSNKQTNKQTNPRLPAQSETSEAGKLGRRHKRISAASRAQVNRQQPSLRPLVVPIAPHSSLAPSPWHAQPARMPRPPHTVRTARTHARTHARTLSQAGRGARTHSTLAAPVGDCQSTASQPSERSVAALSPSTDY